MRNLNKRCFLILAFLFCAYLTALAQVSSKSISGIVTDEKGIALSGVTVSVKGTNITVISDKDGKYAITLPEKSKKLVFSYVGMQSEEMIAAKSGSQNISLKSSAGMLSDFVVVGYGTVRKKDLTGAVGSIKSDQITQVATTDVVQAMQGRIAGVQVIANSGEPGSGAQIRIRGIGSINGSDPIYVVDGYQTGDISFLAPGDIESIDVLKDASATAIYGSRGANGVVLVTTKKGKKGPVKFVVDSYVGNQKAWRTIPMVNATEYANLVLQGYANDGNPLDTSSQLYTRLNYVRQNNYHGTNWQDEVMQSGFMQNHSLSIAGGNDQNRFRLSGTYFTQDGIVRNSSMKKYFLNFSNDLTINKWLTAGISGAFTHFDKNYYNSDLYSGVLTTALAADPLTAAWDKITHNWGRADISYTNNPARAVDELKNNKGYGNYIVANAWAEAKIIKGLSFKSQIGTSLNSGHNTSYSPQFFIAVDEARDQSSLWERRSESKSWLWTNYLNYTKTTQKHNIGAMVGTELQQSSYNDFSATGYNVPADKDLMYLSSSQSTDFTVSSNQSQTSMQSFFGRVNYGFDSKYLLTATVRYDGSSKFLGNNRWGVFPSFAGAWVLSNESFMQNFKPLSLFKIRAGWGRVGNEQSANAYGYVTSVSGNNIYVFNDQLQQGFAPTTLSNPELKWEVNQQTNVGADINFMQNRLSFTADYFDRQTKNMIVSVPIPSYVGAGAPRVNAGTMSNKGFEFTGSYSGGNQLKYRVGANISFIKNKITNLGGGAPQDGGGIGKIGNTTRTQVGMPFPYFYGLKTDGIFNTQEELDAHKNKDGLAIQPNAHLGDVKFIDVNGDGKIDDLDKQNLGNPYPDFQYGFNADLSYKGFDLRIFIQGVQGNSIINGMNWNTRNGSNAGGGWNNFETIRRESWTAASPKNNQPRMTASDPNNNMRFSDRYVMDGSYLRLKNVQLGYSLPTHLLNNLKVSGLRIYVAADNLFTLTRYEGFDPEIGSYYGNPYSYGVDVGTYPQSRTFRAGISLNF
ncbi:TonB-dependent receptor [Ferruginibacter sp.]|uniref:SusC/RagA family TonB-linked outer membrane protein n=1 Tax=Ferruginibacter sp. TaxID=1940288 RepID=UPI0026585BC6|nr:TonB-dependent receptor [Ferruginibacter sp.]